MGMGRTTDPDKTKLAYILYMAGENQKVICDRVGVTAPTLNKWMLQEAWREARAAKTITREQLVNKALNRIGEMMDGMGEGNDPGKIDGFADKLSKMVSSLTRLDKSNTVIDDMDTFMAFNQFLKRRIDIDKELSIELYKAINKYQDIYINERLSQK